MSSSEARPSGAEKKRCFVVMGFGIKTDYATGRKLDLDKSYRLMIKPVVEERGLICVRADEIRHTGLIDVPMYQELLTAHIVVADLSTANPNALYELGIRHALRPHTTVVISENKLSYPFDLNHVLINSYTHLGEAIDFDEVMRFRKVLGETLDAVLAREEIDSPVYRFLNDLDPPSRRGQTARALAEAGEALERAAEARQDTPPPDTKTLSTIIEQGENAINDSRFADAKQLFSLALQLCKRTDEGGHPVAHEDPYLLQRLVLTTYKAKQPDELTALKEALELLNTRLNLDESNDPETVGLGGAVEKRLFDNGQGAEHLDRAIWLYGRGYYLRNDRYNGINLAYLMNVRTDTPLDSKDTEKIADLVSANRIRREVLKLCERELREIEQSERRASSAAPGELEASQRKSRRGDKFWCLATMAEAHFGLGEIGEYERARDAAQKLNPASWMTETFDQQIARLNDLLTKHGHLLDPPWPGK